MNISNSYIIKNGDSNDSYVVDVKDSYTFFTYL